jgi:hypothetical protein
MFKSIKTGFLAVILLSTAIIAKAQKKFTEGTITYGLEYSLTDDQKSMLAGQELPKELKVKFSNGFTQIKMEQGPAIINIINNNNDDTGLILVDVPIAQKQYAVKQTKEQVLEYRAASSKNANFKATGEKQNIGGFNAEKYTYTDGDGKTQELWATTEIEMPAVGTQAFFKDLKAFPVKYSIKQNGILTTNTLKSIAEGKVEKISDEVPSGYEVTTMDAIMRGGQ